MAQQDRTRYNNTTYVSGNNVRKLYEANPARKTVVPDRSEEQERRNRRQEQRQLRRANKLNFLYTMAVSGIVAVIFVICYQYLNLQASVKQNASEISGLQEKLASLTADNDATEISLQTGIDYEAIYEAAVTELGMVYPDKDKVISYNAGVSEYVKQYQDIPAAD